LSELGLRPKELSKRIDKSVRTLARWRKQKIGPKFRKYCGLIYYPAKLIEQWKGVR
jgi:hypothetical protein